MFLLGLCRLYQTELKSWFLVIQLRLIFWVWFLDILHSTLKPFFFFVAAAVLLVTVWLFAAPFNGWSILKRCQYVQLHSRRYNLCRTNCKVLNVNIGSLCYWCISRNLAVVAHKLYVGRTSLRVVLVYMNRKPNCRNLCAPSPSSGRCSPCISRWPWCWGRVYARNYWCSGCVALQSSWENLQAACSARKQAPSWG